MAFDNISATHLQLALTGMTVVFAALAMIAAFIYLLPHVLSRLEVVAPPASGASSSTNGAEEIAAAIGFALHHHETQSTGQPGR